MAVPAQLRGHVGNTLAPQWAATLSEDVQGARQRPRLYTDIFTLTVDLQDATPLLVEEDL